MGKKCAGCGGGGGGGGHRKVRRAKMSMPSHGPEEEAREVPDGGGEDWGMNVILFVGGAVPLHVGPRSIQRS